MDDSKSGENDLHRDRGAEFVTGLGTASVAQLSNGDYDEDCRICQSSYGPINPAQMNCCGRAFHRDCLVEWFSEGRNNTCPICRAELFEKLQEEEEEEEEEEEGFGGPGQEGEGETGEISVDYAYFMGEDSADETDRWKPDDYDDDDFDWDDVDPSTQSDEYILKQLRTGQRHTWGFLGHREQYQWFLDDGADLPPLDPETDDLTIDQDLALFREVQRRGAFKVEGMRQLYWKQRSWADFKVYEHLVIRESVWCVEHQRWFRIGPWDPRRHLTFEEVY